MNQEALHAMFAPLRQASRAAPAADADTRRARLETLATLVRENVERIAEAIDADFGGRSHDETRMLEVLPALRGIRHAQRHVRRWMRQVRRPVDVVFQPASAWLRYEPLGVIGIIAPWNYPLLLSIGPLADALAAGNRAMLKPSELTPRFSELLAQLVARHFPPDLVAVATGGVETARAFSSLPFDHLLFTGSTAVGRQVMRAAAENLTPVTLELGGKSPAFVAADYPLAKAADAIAFGKFLNAGQTCIAPDYVLVPRARMDDFAAAMLDAARRRYPTLAGNADYSAVITPRHRQRLASALDEARAAGARVQALEADGAPEKIAPTLVLDPPLDSLLMREEIFGPVLPLVGYDHLEEAIAFAAARERPLALYCFSGDRAVHRRVLDGVTSGGVTLNGTLLHIAQDSLPFGGIGPSGTGAYHGHEGFKRFSHARAVFKVGPVNVFQRLGPPWTGLARRMFGWLAR